MSTRQQLVTRTDRSSPGTNSREYITVHETANLAAGATAAAHANLQTNGNARTASWHYQVDDVETVQSYPHTTRCWHTGTTTGNASSIGIEICVNAAENAKDTARRFEAAVRRAAALVRRIMAAEGIPLSRVVQHNHWSDKDCPRFLRNGSRGITWADFLELVRDKDADPAPAPPASGALVLDGHAGPATTRRWQQVMGTTVDGVISGQPAATRKHHPRLHTAQYVITPRAGSQLVRAVQRRLGVTDDGYLGPVSVRAVQRRLGVDNDGYFGPVTARALQGRLNDGRF